MSQTALCFIGNNQKPIYCHVTKPIVDSFKAGDCWTKQDRTKQGITKHGRTKHCRKTRTNYNRTEQNV